MSGRIYTGGRSVSQHLALTLAGLTVAGSVALALSDAHKKAAVHGNAQTTAAPAHAANSAAASCRILQPGSRVDLVKLDGRILRVDCAPL